MAMEKYIHGYSVVSKIEEGERLVYDFEKSTISSFTIFKRNKGFSSPDIGEALHPHGLDSKETAEIAELQQRLKDSLHQQGYDKTSPKPASQPNKGTVYENSTNQRRPDQRQYSGPRPQSGGPRPQSGRGYGYRGRGDGYRGRGGGYRGRGQGRPRSPRKDYQQEDKGNNPSVNSSQ